jgi:serine/threonine protein kinase
VTVDSFGGMVFNDLFVGETGGRWREVVSYEDAGVRTVSAAVIDWLGGMGEVYQAFDSKRDRIVALKLLPEAFSKDDEYQRRFRRESHAVARLREPHVIPIHDYGEINRRLFIDMRLVDGGRNIATILADQGPFALARAVHLISQVADALNAAHADGLIHCDIKPSNVLVTSSDFVYVVDFGIAHTVGHTLTSLTMSGTTVGTLDYMAPERFGNGPIDCRADVYSLACLLYECLTGARPFTGTEFTLTHVRPPSHSSTEAEQHQFGGARRV